MFAFVFLQATQSVLALGPVDETALRSAWALYTQQKYAASADAFEALISKSAPNARLYYYAALANKSGNRSARAKQLAQYVIANFPGTAEASSAQKLFSDSGATTADALPDSLKGKSIDELMQTEEGRKALKEALAKQKSSAPSSTLVASTAPAPASKSSRVRESNDAITAETIAKDGPSGISQFNYNPDAWLESSMSALCLVPHGQELLAHAIRNAGGGAYIVRFPSDAVEYTITPQIMESARVRDKALWATLIHCAEVMKFRGSGGLEEGLSWLTGKKAEKLFASSTTEQTLTRFISEAMKAQNPIVCETLDDFGTAPELMEANHAYTIVAFDPATNLIEMRDPHGDNSRRFRLKTDPDHKKFEQLNGGVFRIHISLFPQYFSQVARSSI